MIRMKEKKKNHVDVLGIFEAFAKEMNCKWTA